MIDRYRQIERERKKREKKEENFVLLKPEPERLQLMKLFYISGDLLPRGARRPN